MESFHVPKQIFFFWQVLVMVVQVIICQLLVTMEIVTMMTLSRLTQLLLMAHHLMMTKCYDPFAMPRSVDLASLSSSSEDENIDKQAVVSPV